MTRTKSHRIVSMAVLIVTFAALSGAIMFAQTKVEGVIKGRSGRQDHPANGGLAEADRSAYGSY